MTYSVAVYSRFAMQYQSISEKFSVKTGSEYLLFDLASIPYHFLLLLHSGFLVGRAGAQAGPEVRRRGCHQLLMAVFASWAVKKSLQGLPCWSSG